MNTRTAQVVLNTITSYIRFAVSLLVWFFLTPFIINTVGRNDFGLWSLTFSVIGFFGLLDFGFGTGVVKYVAECKGAKNVERRNRILSTLAIVYLTISLIACTSVGALSFFYNHLFSIPDGEHEKAYALLWILAGRSIFLGLPLSLFRGILFGEQKIYLINLIQGVAIVVYALTSWIVLEKGMGIIALAWINFGAMLLEHLGYIYFSYKEVSGLRISFSLAEKKLFREVASFSIYSFIVNVSNLILLKTDPIIIKFFMPLSSVAIYALALKIAENALLLIKQFVNVLTPLIADFKGSGDEQKIRFILINCTKFALAPAVMIAVGGSVFAREGLYFWVGPEFVMGAPVLIVLMIAFTMSVPQLIASNVLTMTGHHKITARVSAMSILINIVCSILLIMPLGFIGVALGTLIATLIIDIFYILKIVFKEYQINYLDYIYRAVLTAVAPGVLQLVLTYGMKIWFPPENLAMIAFELLPGVLLYSSIFFLFFVEPSEKRLLREKLFARISIFGIFSVFKFKH